MKWYIIVQHMGTFKFIILYPDYTIVVINTTKTDSARLRRTDPKNATMSDKNLNVRHDVYECKHGNSF